jgi:hypothetical protein
MEEKECLQAYFGLHPFLYLELERQLSLQFVILDYSSGHCPKKILLQQYKTIITNL